MLKRHKRLPDLALELSLRYRGWQIIAGLDEAGRGAWAGPVTAAAVVLPLDEPGLAAALHGLNDSKALNPQQRQRWYTRLCDLALGWSVGHATPAEIDQQGIVPATRMAMQRALDALSPTPQHLLIDYLPLPTIGVRQVALPRGDARALSIAAAAVIAKVSRDALMAQCCQDYPAYDFDQNKGYGTHAHRQALDRLGPSALHRHSFAPVRAWIEQESSSPSKRHLPS